MLCIFVDKIKKKFNKIINYEQNMEKIGLFYAPAKGSTEKVAKLVQKKIGENKVEMFLVDQNTSPEEFLKYKKLIFGISTVGRERWDSSYEEIGWDFMISKIENIDLSEQTIAIFGLGNQILYPDNFADGMGFLAQQLEESNAKIVGNSSVDDYDFADSEAFVSEGLFYGVAVDEDNEPEKTDGRITKWLEMIKEEIGF